MRLYSFLRTWLATFVGLGLALAFMLASPAALAAITFNNTVSGGTPTATTMELIREAVATGPTGQYVGLGFSSDVPLTNVYARAIVGGTNFSLDLTEVQDHALGDLSTTLKPSYWYLNFSNVTINNGTFQVQIYSGGPPGVGTLQGTSPSYILANANTDNFNATQSSVFSTTFNGGNPIVLGQSFDVVVCYNIVSNNNTSLISISPAATSAFDPAGLQLLSVPTVQLFNAVGCGGTLINTFSNQLYFPTGGAGAVVVAAVGHRVGDVGYEGDHQGLPGINGKYHFSFCKGIRSEIQQGRSGDQKEFIYRKR